MCTRNKHPCFIKTNTGRQESSNIIIVDDLSTFMFIKLYHENPPKIIEKTSELSYIMAQIHLTDSHRMLYPKLQNMHSFQHFMQLSPREIKF